MCMLCMCSGLRRRRTLGLTDGNTRLIITTGMHKIYTCIQKDNKTKAIFTVMNVVCVSMLTGSEAVYNTGNNNNII